MRTRAKFLMQLRSLLFVIRQAPQTHALLSTHDKLRFVSNNTNSLIQIQSAASRQNW
jgi:hypothetical protein